MREQDDRGRLSLAIRQEKERIVRSLINLRLNNSEISNSTKMIIEEIETLRNADV